VWGYESVWKSGEEEGVLGESGVKITYPQRNKSSLNETMSM